VIISAKFFICCSSSENYLAILSERERERERERDQLQIVEKTYTRKERLQLLTLYRLPYISIPMCRQSSMSRVRGHERGAIAHKARFAHEMRPHGREYFSSPS